MSTIKPFNVLVGPAGSGKSTIIRAMNIDPEGSNVADKKQFDVSTGTFVYDHEQSLNGRYVRPLQEQEQESQTPQQPKVLLTATTGVAAYNLGDGATTINTLMRYYDEASLYQQLNRHNWYEKVYDSLRQYKGIVIDEISMMPSRILDVLTSVFIKINDEREREHLQPLEITLSGDFCQLPPVQGDFAFQCGWWPSIYQEHVTKLTKIWRQDHPALVSALTYARHGEGASCAFTLKPLIRTTAEPFYHFDGFSLYPINASVEKHNRIRLDALETRGYSLASERWIDSKGSSYPEELKIIPDVQAYKDNCRVRFTVNLNNHGIINGQLGTLVTCKDGKQPIVIVDGSKEDNYEVTVPYSYKIAYRPTTSDDHALIKKTAMFRYWPAWEVHKDTLLQDRELPFYDPFKEMIAYAVVKYFPMTLGYASTFHKAQGLQFDKLQIDVRNRFAGNPQMTYVALSRARNPEGLLIVGDMSILSRRVLTSNVVKQWC